MDVKTKRLECSIIEETYAEIERLAIRQNSQFDNVVDRVLRRGIADIYKQWPNLREDQK